MIFLGYFLIYIVRNNLSVHVVAMAHLVRRDEQPRYSYNITYRGTRAGMLDLISWDSMKMGKLFSAYHIGYCVCFPIFHNIGDKLGPTWVVGITGLISGFLCCLTPASAYYNFWLVFAVRILEGFCAGAMQPNMVQVLRNWVPPIERNHFIWTYCGCTAGTFFTFLLCAAIHYYSRWPVGFYLSGGLQITWAAIWVLVITDLPEKHPCISEEELTYLVNAIGTIFTIKITNSHIPWNLILKSIPFWALCILNFGYTWMLLSLCLYGPLFYAKASALTAIPFFLRLVLGILLIQTFQHYRHKPQIKRITHIRKYFTIISHIVPGLLVSSMWLFHATPGPVILSIAVSLTAAAMDLTLDVCQELTPTFMNSINTVIKIIGNTAGIIISLCVGLITQKHKNLPHVWKHIWCFNASVLFMSGCIFLIWGETHVQPWNYVQRQKRPRRPKYLAKPSTTMSDILEVDEDRSSHMASQTNTSQTPKLRELK